MSMVKEKTYLERVTEFHKIYANEIRPILSVYEKKRKRMLLGINISILTILFSFLIFIFVSMDGLLIFMSDIPEGLYLGSYILCTIAFIIGVIVASTTPNVFIKEIKIKCLPKVLQVFSCIKWITNEHFIPDSELERSALFAPYNRRRSDDSFEGSYKGVKFQICETAMQYESGSGKNKHVENIFDGVVITFSANKDIKNRTMIATKGDKTAKSTGFYFVGFVMWIALKCLDIYFENPVCYFTIVGIFSLIAIILYFVSKNVKNEEALDEVKLEDPKFVKRFNVYSSDQVEARYLVTPSFMERFQNLNTAFGAKKAKCSFYDDKIMFAISTNKNLFEVGSIWRSLEDPKSINQLFNELYSVYRMIDYFKLDQKIGL